MILSGEALDEIRSSERSRSWHCGPVYKHRTPTGAKPQSNYEL
jgi:hypothetical protein